MRFPSDEDWIERQPRRKVVIKQLGRGVCETILGNAEQLPALLATLGGSREDDMACSDRLLDLLGHDVVGRDVADVVHVRVKTDEIDEDNFGIYENRTYARVHLRL